MVRFTVSSTRFTTGRGTRGCSFRLPTRKKGALTEGVISSYVTAPRPRAPGPAAASRSHGTCFQERRLCLGNPTSGRGGAAAGLGAATGKVVRLFAATGGPRRVATLAHRSRRPILGERLRLRGPWEGRECGHLPEAPTGDAGGGGLEARATAVGRSVGACARARPSFP